MQNVEAPVGGDSVLPGGQHPSTMSLTVLFLPHDRVLPDVPHHTRNESVITLVHVDRVWQTIPDARGARCNTETERLRDVKSMTQAGQYLPDYRARVACNLYCS